MEGWIQMGKKGHVYGAQCTTEGVSKTSWHYVTWKQKGYWNNGQEIASLIPCSVFSETGTASKSFMMCLSGLKIAQTVRRVGLWNPLYFLVAQKDEYIENMFWDPSIVWVFVTSRHLECLGMLLRCLMYHQQTRVHILTGSIKTKGGESPAFTFSTLHPILHGRSFFSKILKQAAFV